MTSPGDKPAFDKASPISVGDHAPLDLVPGTVGAGISSHSSIPEEGIYPSRDMSQTKRDRALAMLHANPSIRFARKLGDNIVKKIEDVGIGLMGATTAISEVGVGVGKTAVSGVGAGLSVVEGGVTGAFGGGAARRGPDALQPRIVDTVTEIDISGTVLKDLNRAIEVNKMKGTSTADSPLNTPWIMLIFPITPIAFLYTKSVFAIILPPTINTIYSVWTFFGWRFWFCLTLLIFLLTVVLWETVKNIGPLRTMTLQVDVAAIKFRRKLEKQMTRQMPKIHKALDKIAPPFTAALVTADRLLTPRIGFSPLLSFNAKLNGWTYDPEISDVCIDQSSEVDGLQPSDKSDHAYTTSRRNPAGEVVSAEKRDRGDAVVVSEEGIVSQPTGGLEYDADRVSEQITPARSGAGEMYEHYFSVDICLRYLSELPREFSSVWVEWMHRGMVLDRSVVRDVTTSEKWKGFGASFDDYSLTGEVRLPMRASTSKLAGGFFDVPIKLVLKGRDGRPIYANDGARRYLRGSPPISVIGELELSALRIGVGSDQYGIVHSELRIPFHAVGVSQYRAAMVRASARIVPVDSSSYSYRQMLSPLPNGEWTVRINIFELRSLHGVDNSSSSDPFVSASVLGMVKKTDRQRQTLSCMVNQLLFFSKACTGLEFEKEKIVIEVMDWNRITAAKLIGHYTFDAKRILELPGRELYRKWFALQDPNGGKKPTGFIKLSITVVPPGYPTPHHTETEDMEEYSNANLLKNNVLTTPKISYQNWAVHVTVGWADMLPRMSSHGYRDAIRGCVVFNYSGFQAKTTRHFIGEAKEVVDKNIGTACRVLPQRRVIWNEEYVLPLTVTNGRVTQEGINLKLMHKILPMLQSPSREDHLIGEVTVSFDELFKNMTTAVVRGDPADGEDEGDRIRDVALLKPRYYNFYGKPDGKADLYDKGVAFRGRLLVGVAAKPGEVNEPFLRSCPPPPRPKLEFYKLTFCVLRATELPLSDGWSVLVVCRIGLYEFGHSIPKAVAQGSCAEWDENCALSIPNMQFPEDVEQIPDLFITIWGRKPCTVSELEDKQLPPGQGGMHRNRSSGGDNDDGPPGGAILPFGTGEMVVSQEYVPPIHENVVDNDNSKDGQWQPKAFLRLSGKNLACGQQEPRWMFMDYPGNNVLGSSTDQNQNQNQVPGSILMSASLSKYDPMHDDESVDDVPVSQTLLPGARASADITISESFRHDELEGEIRPADNALAVASEARRSSAGDILGVPYSGPKPYAFSYPLGGERSFTLRAVIWKGRNLPAADESGLSDPVLTVSIGDKRQTGKIICKQTINPLWEETIEVEDIKVRDGERKPNVNVLIYDYDGEGQPMDYLGRCIVPSAVLDSTPPSLDNSKWYPVFSVNPSVIVGEILADFQLVPTAIAIRNPLQRLVSPSRLQSTIRISIVGMRDLKLLQYAAGNMFVECSISGISVFSVQSKRGTILQKRSHEANCNVLDVLMLGIEIPEDIRLAPALNIFAYAKYCHGAGPELVATGCIPLEKWFAEHNRRLVTGESLVDDSFGLDAPVPQRLFDSEYGYRFRKDVRGSGEEPIGAASLRLHEIKIKDKTEKDKLMLTEKLEVLRVGFSKEKKSDEEGMPVKREKPPTLSERLAVLLAPFRALKYSVSDKIADIMPDVALALGVEVEEDISLSTLLKGGDDDKLDYDGTRHLKRDRGFCPIELEMEFSEPAYGEFLLFRGDNRALGTSVGRIEETIGSTKVESDGGQGFPPLLPFEEAVTTKTLLKREQRRAALEGARSSVGKVKARLDLMELDPGDRDEWHKVRATSLRSFGRVFVPTEVVVRVYVLRGISLQQTGSQCNPYLTARFYGGYPDYYSQKHDPVIDNDNPDFFCMFESRVKMPGGCVRLEVKDRVLPEVTVPVSYPMIIQDDNQKRFGLVKREIPFNVGRIGLGWSEDIGETSIDLDARWYNSAWRALAKTPVERRSLTNEDSSNLKGQLEVFVDMFDAHDVDKRPKLYKPLNIRAPLQEKFEMRIVIYKISDCMLPYKLVNYDPAKLAAFYVQARLGNRPEDVRKTERCKYVADGVAEFNWRMKWEMRLPSSEIKPRLKLEVFDDTMHGFGDDQLCATVDIKLRSLFDDLVLNKKPIIKKKQWVYMHHPNYPDVESQIQVSLELTTGKLAAKKKCFSGRDGYKKSQHEDYILPEPFQPAAFSLYNPVPYFNYLIISTIKNLQWTMATILLLFPFIPMLFQFVFMITPWQWYATGGMVGLIVFIRISMVSAARSQRMQAEEAAALESVDEDHT